MRHVRDANFEEFVRWYLLRERRKRGQHADFNGRSWNSLVTEMRGAHPEKLRSWFEKAWWSVVSLEHLHEVMSLVCVDGPDTRRNGLVSGAGPDHRVARNVIAAAYQTSYFDNESIRRSNAVEGHFRQDRIEAYRRNWPRFEGEERIAVCTLNMGEKLENPGGTYYLHDGFGRLLPWLYGIAYEGREYCPVEAFLAQQI